MKKLMLALAVIAVAAAPLTGHAAEVADVACSGITTADTSTPSTGSCSETFTLDGSAVFISQLNGTHANFVSPGATGSLTMKWTDSTNALIAEITCQGVVALGPVPQAGGFLTEGALYPDPGAVCTVNVLSSAYAAGTQTLTVNATSARFRSATYWGRLVLTDEADPGA